MILLGGMTATLVILAPLFTKSDYQRLFCEAFDDINAMPYRKNICTAFEYAHVCRSIEAQERFSCEVFK